jgi:hypothetical protein
MEQARTHSDIYMAWFELRKGGGQIEEEKSVKNAPKRVQIALWSGFLEF